ncbi:MULTISPECIES: hypothetical protein [unclassified Pseudomonas]|uniref:hypothetical protein n=1 Tax=unclassified Pseudomonas TaxID=196821 RepID=UPI000B853E2B|nr:MULTISPECIES: hypothetical protein [unclassified Pseudomonas]
MFIDHDAGQPYTPQLSYFLGCFDIYDREETLGEELAKFDPNNQLDREALILKYCLPRKRPHRQRFLLYKCLEEALKDDDYDFESLVIDDPEEYSSYPDGWEEMENVRGFFEDIYRLASELWKDDLNKAGLEDQSTW